jgi:hypothetical protein
MFKVSTSKEATQESSGGKFIGKSGIYDITILFASVDTTKNGATQVNFNIEYNGNTQTLWGPIVQNKDGSDNTIGMTLINKLAIIAGLGDGDEPTIEEETHPVGKDNTERDFAVITDFSDLECKIRVQEEYSTYNGNISDKLNIKAFYSADGAVADEIVNETEIGVQLEKDQAYASNVTYRDGLTAEDVDAWIAGGRKNGGGNQPKAKAKPSAKKGPLFKR